MDTQFQENFVYGTRKETWKNIKFPSKYKTTQQYQISNYGRVRNSFSEDSGRIKKPRLYDGRLIYRFSFTPSANGGKRLIWHIDAKNLVAQHFHKGYKKGKYAVWKDYNRLNNFYSNILILDPSEGRSHAAKGAAKTVKQILVVPPKEEPLSTRKYKTESHKVETDDSFFKCIPNFSKYECNRFGVIRRYSGPTKGRVMKQRLHPDKFYILDLIDNQNKKRTAYTHKVVAETWNINVLPEKRTIVVHLDGDTLNNNSDNLEWMDHSEALRHQFSINQRDNKRSWKTRKKLYGKSGQKKTAAKKIKELISL